MLNAMRSGAQSWAVKIFLGLLVLSFALWGIGDIFLGSGSNAFVAKVEGTPISAYELDRAFEAQVDQYAQIGARLDRQQAVAMGVMGQTLNDLMLQRKVELHAAEIGLSVSDEEIATAVRTDQRFSGVGGFDREVFQLFLRSNGLSEQGFLQTIKGGLLRSKLASAFAGQISPPKAITDLISTYRGETRGGRLLIIDPSIVTVEPPTDADLQAYLDTNQSSFMAPEFRAIELIILDPEELAADINVSDEQIAVSYEDRIANFTSPAIRTVTQLLANDRQILNTAIEQINQGGDLDAVVDAMAQQGLSREELGPFETGDLPEPLDGAVWAASSGAFGEPVESAFGFHSFKVIEEVTATVTPLSDVRDEIAQNLALDEANDLLPDLARALDDEIGAGETIQSAATRLQLPLFSIPALDRLGNSQDGRPLEAPSLSADMLQTIFESEANRVSLLETAEDDRQYVFSVASITETRPKSLDEVRDDATHAVLAERRLDEAQKAAEELLADAKAAGGIDGMAEPEGVSLHEFGPLRRADIGLGPGFDQAGLDAVFATENGALADTILVLRDGPAIAIIDDIDQAPASESNEFKVELENAIQSDLIGQYAVALQNMYNHEINESVLTQLMQPPQAHQHGGM